MMRWARVAALLFAVALTAGACQSSKKKAEVGGGGSQTNTVEEGRALKTVSPGKLTVCTHMPNPPFEYQEGTELRGIEIDLIKAATGRLGIGADFKNVDTTALIDSLKSRQCDVGGASITVTDDTKKLVDFTQPYFQLHQALLVRKGDDAAYHDLPDLNGHKVAAASLDAATYAQKQKIATQGFGTTAEAVAALKAGQVDGVITDEAAALSTALAGDTVVVKAFSDGPVLPLAFAVVKGNTAVLDAVNNALTQVRSDDSYRIILTNYLGGTAGQS